MAYLKLNKKGLGHWGLIVTVLLLIGAAIVLFLFVGGSYKKGISNIADRTICKISILIGRFDCETEKVEIKDERELADLMVDAWGTLFKGNRKIFGKFLHLPEIHCFNFAKFTVKKDMRVSDVEKILKEEKYNKYLDVDNIFREDEKVFFIKKSEKEKFEKLKVIIVGKEYVVTFVEELSIGIKGKGLAEIDVLGKTKHAVVVAPKEEAEEAIGCDVPHHGKNEK